MPWSLPVRNEGYFYWLKLFKRFSQQLNFKKALIGGSKLKTVVLVCPTPIRLNKNVGVMSLFGLQDFLQNLGFQFIKTVKKLILSDLSFILYEFPSSV
jgi:hypothetical protein